MAMNWNPWSDVNQLLSHGGAFDRTLIPERVVHSLPLDIRQTDEAFWIEASVPGFRPDDMEITLDENLLTIRGTPRQEDEALRGGYVQRERQLSSVYPSVPRCPETGTLLVITHPEGVQDHNLAYILQRDIAEHFEPAAVTSPRPRGRP